MAKSILISIKPRYVADILNHKKTIEIRKTKPKCELPIDVYIYCTKDSKTKLSSNSLKYYNVDNKDYKNYLGNWNGKVVAKFTLNYVGELKVIPNIDCNRLIPDICITPKELENYLKNKVGYAWHISNLLIFDKPKELSDFYGLPKKLNTTYGSEMVSVSLTKAPQSYMFIEVGE